MLLTHWLRNLQSRLHRPARHALRRRSGRGWQSPTGHVPAVESLEGRLLLSGSVVTNTNDSGTGSLRQAILDSNASVGVRETITFDIPTTDPGYNPATGAFVIKPSATPGTGVALPLVTDPVTIDGYSQPGASTNTLAVGDNAVLKIEVSGANTNPADGVWGMEISAGNCLVRGLAIDGFTGPELGLATNGGNVVQGNFIGTDITGSVGTPGGPWGIYVVSNGNTIGSQGVAGDFAERNVVFSGIRTIEPYVTAGAVYLNSSNNIVAGNYVGTDKTGDHALGSSGVIYQGSGNGVVFWGDNNRIGSDGSGTADIEERNVISGSLQGGGVWMSGRHNVVAGDYIGTDATGTHAVGNAGGLVNWGGDGNMVGTNAAGVPNASTRNLISGNSGPGIAITIGGANYIVKGNYIGTDPTGTVALPNAGWGIQEGMNGGSNETFGGPTAAERNLISGNQYGGIDSWGPHDVFQGNYIGVDVTGTVALSNKGGNGMLISGTGDLVGGAAPGQGNLVSGNASGIGIYGTNITVQGNYIGTDKSGTVKIGNGPPGGIYGYPSDYYGGGVGIIVNAGSSDIQIGGTAPGTGNVISGNNDTGIVIGGNSAYPAGPTGVVVQGNYIGTDATGTAPLGNGGYGGILVWDYAQNTLIGGTAPGAGNVISANANSNVELLGTSPYHLGADGNVVQGNLIGTDKTGTKLVGSTPYGIQIFGAYGNTIGGTAPGVANVIAGATIAGVEIRANTLLPGLFGWFRGDDNNGDQSNPSFNGNDVATLVNGATYAPGVSGQAFQLNGANQYAQFPSSTAYDQTFPLSLDAWVKPNSLSNPGASQTIFSKYDSTDTVNQGESWLLQEADGGRIVFKVSQTLNGSISRTVETDNPVLATGQWQHVAAVFDPTNQSMTIYVNGGAVPSTVQAGSANVAYIALSNAPVRIGKSFDGVSNSWNGELDELGVIIGYPLTAAQVKSIYASHGQGQGGGNVVQGNFIGTDSTGSLNLGNPGDGVRIEWYNNYGNVTSPSNNTIGGTNPGAGNTIANNGGNGVVLRTDYLNPYNNLIQIDTGTGNAILGNSIHDNHKIGIDLVGGTEDANGVTSNHTGFTRGPDYLQNHPLVTSAAVANGTVAFQGMLNSTSNSTYRVEFFANPTSASGTEEGQVYLGSTSVTTDGSGNAIINAQLALKQA